MVNKVAENDEHIKEKVNEVMSQERKDKNDKMVNVLNLLFYKTTNAQECI
jgi:hypothetical protein